MLNSYKKKIKRSNEKISESKKLIYIYVCMYVERERERTFCKPFLHEFNMQLYIYFPV